MSRLQVVIPPTNTIKDGLFNYGSTVGLVIHVKPILSKV